MHIHQLEKGNEIIAVRGITKTVLSGIAAAKTDCRLIDLRRGADGRIVQLSLDAMPCLQAAYDAFIVLVHNALVQELGALDDEFNLL